MEFLTNKSKSLTKREQETFYDIKNDAVWDKKDFIKMCKINFEKPVYIKISQTTVNLL